MARWSVFPDGDEPVQAVTALQHRPMMVKGALLMSVTVATSLLVIRIA